MQGNNSRLNTSSLGVVCNVQYVVNIVLISHGDLGDSALEVVLTFRGSKDILLLYNFEHSCGE